MIKRRENIAVTTMCYYPFMEPQKQDLIIGKEDGIVEVYTIAEDDVANLAGTFVRLLHKKEDFFRVLTNQLRVFRVEELVARITTKSLSAPSLVF